MTIFAPPFTKKSPAARLKMRLPPALTLVVGAARPESATHVVPIIPVSHEGVSLPRACESAVAFWEFWQPADGSLGVGDGSLAIRQCTSGSFRSSGGGSDLG